MIDLLLASNNPGKLRELRLLLPSDVEIRTLEDLGLESPEETGATIAANSALKATIGAKASGLLTLADDSGLEVDALNGAPGVISARYSGSNATDQSNIDLLLSQLAQVPQNQRTAQFVCVLTLANPDGVLASASGRWPGQIIDAQRGTNGFGYDPIMQISDGRTVAELTNDEKNAISHRGIALRDIRPALLIAIAAQRFSRQGDGQ